MQKIKSQSPCQTPKITSINNQKSKKLPNGHHQTVNELGKSKNLLAVENSLNTIRAISKATTSSMKNLRVGSNSEAPKKTSVPTTSRVGKASTSAISARILKEIVGYSQISHKEKESLKEPHENREKTRIEAEINSEIENLTTKERFNQNNPSFGKNSSKEENNNNLHLNKITQELTLSEKRKSEEICLEDNIPKTKKNEFFEIEVASEIANISDKRIETELTKAKSWKDSDYCFNEFELNNGSTSEFHEVSENFKNLASPDTFDHKPVTFGSSKVSWLKEKVKCEQFFEKHKDHELLSAEEEEKALLKSEISRLTILLEHSTAIIEEKYEANFKDIIPFWKEIIRLEKKLPRQKEEIKICEKEFNHLKTKELDKKTELYELNRDQIRRRKQKECLSKSSKEKNIQEAIIAQEDIRIKLSSKADYDHVILFNQKVVLSGQASIENLRNIFVEMFENRLAKKFILITKKEVANLSVNDSRLVQEFLKKIQELENSYFKIDSLANKSHGVSEFYEEEQFKLEQIVEEIQEISVSLLNLESVLALKKEKLHESLEEITAFQQKIFLYIEEVGRNISREYKACEGFSFDFELMLEEKYSTGFEEYKREIINRNEILSELSFLNEMSSPNHQITEIISHHELSISDICLKRGSVSFSAISSNRRQKKAPMVQNDKSFF